MMNHVAVKEQQLVLMNNVCDFKKEAFAQYTHACTFYFIAFHKSCIIFSVIVWLLLLIMPIFEILFLSMQC